MKKHLKNISESLCNRKGASVVLVLMILLLLFIFTGMLLFIFKFWEKTSYKIFTGKTAQHLAKIGIDNAIWELDNDSREYDAFTDGWRASFEGDEVDLNDDVIPDAKWFYTKDNTGIITGRYAVLVEDESGKININYAGGAGWLPTHTVSDIDIFSELIGKKRTQNIIAYRKQRKYIIPSDVKLVDGISEEIYKKIKNHITTFSYDLNVNSEGKERININKKSVVMIFNKLKELGYENDVASQVALNIIAYRDKSRVPPQYQIGNKTLLGINKTPYFNEIEAVKTWSRETIGNIVMLREKGGQFIEIFNPYSEPLDISGWRIKGVITLFSGFWNEVYNESEEILDDITEGETNIAPERVKSIVEKVVSASIVIPNGTKIPPRSYYTIGDLISIIIVIIPGDPPIIFPLFVPIREPGGCQYYEPILAVNPGSLSFIDDVLKKIPLFANLGLDFTMRLYDSKDNLIEHTEYIVDSPFTTVGKNDPRMSGIFDWVVQKPTPGKPNITFQPWIGGEFGTTDWLLNWPTSFVIKNDRFNSISELSFIHKKEHWKTLDFWKHGTDRKLIDHFTVVENPEEPTYGRVNINTASEQVLQCLPLVDNEVAKAIIDARPYKDISDILGLYGDGSSPQELLSRAMTKYGFNFWDNTWDLFLDEEKEKELIFSRIIDLITVRSNVFKIITVGQKVQDINNNGKIEEEEIIAEKKIVLWYDRNKKRVLYRREIQ
ncbi:MAG: helix-hairpin-helix domain-containing protein [bacterium]|nr:helix-hairpin-helix domain-containing protein [bacterium]